MHRILGVALGLATVQAAMADQITLRNGDRITGSVVKADLKEVVVATPAAANVTIQWSAIEGLTADGPVYVGLVDGTTVAGALELADGQLTIRTEAAGVVTAAFADMRTMRNRAEQTAFETQMERYRNPRLVDLWTGFLDLGFAATKGNADTQTFTISSRADRATNRDKIGVYFTSIFASTSTTGTSVTTANSKRGGITYDVNLNQRWFAWGSVDLEADEFQRLDLRFVPQGGAGHHSIQNERTKLDFRTGASGNREFFSTGLKRDSAEIVIGEDFSHSFSKTTALQQRLRYFANLTEGGAYRLNFDTTFATALAKWFSLQFTVSDRYLSNPVPGRKSNDILYSTGIRVSFGQ
jgi:putative salt-induced outer membrane protein YdiY